MPAYKRVKDRLNNSKVIEDDKYWKKRFRKEWDSIRIALREKEGYEVTNYDIR